MGILPIVLTVALICVSIAAIVGFCLLVSSQQRERELQEKLDEAERELAPIRSERRQKAIYQMLMERRDPGGRFTNSGGCVIMDLASLEGDPVTNEEEFPLDAGSDEGCVNMHLDDIPGLRAELERRSDELPPGLRRLISEQPPTHLADDDLLKTVHVQQGPEGTVIQWPPSPNNDDDTQTMLWSPRNKD